MVNSGVIMKFSTSFIIYCVRIAIMFGNWDGIGILVRAQYVIFLTFYELNITYLVSPTFTRLVVNLNKAVREY